jgi:GGDEF domain-containing protein
MPDRAVRISAGCVINRGEILIYERMYRMADRCLYEAKRSGKGKFVIQQNALIQAWSEMEVPASG